MSVSANIIIQWVPTVVSVATLAFAMWKFRKYGKEERHKEKIKAIKERIDIVKESIEANKSKIHTIEEDKKEECLPFMKGNSEKILRNVVDIEKARWEIWELFDRLSKELVEMSNEDKNLINVSRRFGEFRNEIEKQWRIKGLMFNSFSTRMGSARWLMFHAKKKDISKLERIVEMDHLEKEIKDILYETISKLSYVS